ncbi:aminopeptidase P family protein [Allorhizocola rhizosphaerae]|uniref:aminopeptidase P family protein n=1 Tax=Allorhizocola rhizosphaerae TaxID=1872709 RepID=UPI000E3CD6A5|nr:aminopeptidase P family protein [Allorhizocola rhizosphaerae]
MNEQFKTASHDLPVGPELEEFMRVGWLDSGSDAERDAVAEWTPLRRKRLHEAFPGERLLIPAGTFKQRSNDQFYRFRPHSAYTWLTGDQAPEGVLVIEPGGDSVLYMRPRLERHDNDRMYGEFWVGRRPTLRETSQRLGIETRHIDELHPSGRSADDPLLAAVLSELRLVKDEWEVAQIEEAIAITTRGFEDVVRALPRAGSERALEGVFWSRARLEGNDVGYHSIVAAGAHAAVLHWTENDGPLRDGELLLLDAGAETRTLYTADITRVLPISGRFTPLQRDLYELCRTANDAALAVLKPGRAYRDFHRAAMAVLSDGLVGMGLLSQADADKELYRRWTLCGSGHMLGLDVHDCAQARAQFYLDGVLAEGHVLTVEPGIYFQPDDGLIPAELRGMGLRIEENVLITSDGYRMLSHALPREASAVEAWMDSLA